MRTKKSIYNALSVAISYVLRIILAFATKTVLINTLGDEYNGIDGLFTSIISMLSIAELGIGMAINYNLYKPIKENDTRTVQSIIAFYKKCYIVIACIVTLAGIIIMPFVPSLIGEVSITDNVYLIYSVFLLDSVSTYLLSYKQSIFVANQQNYVINFAAMIKTVAVQASKILILVLTQNFLLYVLISVIFNCLLNFGLFNYANIKYPFLKEKDVPKLDNKIVDDIKTKVKGLIFHKIGGYVVLGTDNILISKFCGVISVGFYSNYYLIINHLQQLIGQMIDAVVPSVGNLLVEKNYKKNTEIYNKIHFLVFNLFMVFSVCYFAVVQDFIALWIGQERLLNLFTVYCMSLNFFIYGMRKPMAVFENAAGIFYENRFVPIFESVTNIVASIILVNIIGLPGIIIGTTISSMWIFFYDYPKYVWKKVFNDVSIKKYYFGILKSLIIWHLCLAITLIIVNLIDFCNIKYLIVKFILKGVIAVFVTALYAFVLGRKSSEFRYYKELVKGKILKQQEKNI